MGWEQGFTIQSENLLFVEGSGDQNLMTELCQHLGILHALQSTAVSGFSGFKNLKVLPLLPDFHRVQRMGIIKDADEDATQAFQELCNILGGAKLPVPTEPMISTPNPPHLSIMILPPTGEGTGRMIEDMLFESVAHEPAAQCINQYFECLAMAAIPYPPHKIPKTKIREYRYCLPDQKVTWAWDAPAFAPVRRYLLQLVGQ